MSFLSDYGLYTEGNEAPQEFHVWAGLSCLSHLMGRRVWTNENVYKAYTNLYVILVGGPGSKKSTAMRLARNIVSLFPRIPQAGSSHTREAIIKFMAETDSPCLKAFKHGEKVEKYSHFSIFADELVNLINSGGNPIGMINFFTEVWDTPFFRDATKNKGDFGIIGPYVPILGCMTPSTIRGLKTHEIIGGGMIRRCIFVYPEKRGAPEPEPKFLPEQEDALLRCLTFAKNLQEDKIGGEFTWESRSTREIFNKWYIEKWARMEKETSEAKGFFLESAGELSLKLSMLLRISEDPGGLVHTRDSIELAIALIKSIEDNGPRIFESRGKNTLSDTSIEVERLIVTSSQPILLSKIRQIFWKDAQHEDTDKILDHLAQTGKIVLWNFTDKRIVYNFASTKEVKDAWDESLAQKKNPLTGETP
jgi:hypothetical protein